MIEYETTSDSSTMRSYVRLSDCEFTSEIYFSDDSTRSRGMLAKIQEILAPCVRNLSNVTNRMQFIFLGFFIGIILTTYILSIIFRVTDIIYPAVLMLMLVLGAISILC